MAVPLERQAKDFKAMGMRLSTATLSNWVIHAAENFMKPIWIMSKVKADAVWITKLSRKCLIMITFSV